LIQSLSQTNQSLLNQVRGTDISTLTGLMHATNQMPVDADLYISTDDRELAAYRESVAQLHGLGEEISDEDLDTFRSAL